MTLCAGRALLGAGERCISVEMQYTVQEGAGSVAVRPTDAASRCLGAALRQAGWSGGRGAGCAVLVQAVPRRTSVELCETLLVFIYISTHTYSIVSSLWFCFIGAEKPFLLVQVHVKVL